MRVGGSTVTVHVNVGLLARRHPRLESIRTAAARKLKIPLEQIDGKLEGRLAKAVEHLANQYYDQHATSLQKIHDLRSGLSDVYDGVLKGEFADPNSVSKMFADLEAELGKLKSPREFFASLSPTDLGPAEGLHPDIDPGAPPPPRRPGDGSGGEGPTGPVRRPLGDGDPLAGTGDALMTLDGPSRDGVRNARDVAAEQLQRVISAETEGGRARAVEGLGKAMREAGSSEAEIDPAVKGAIELGDTKNRRQAQTGQARQAEAVAKLRDERAVADRRQSKIESLERMEAALRAKDLHFPADQVAERRRNLEAAPTRGGAIGWARRLSAMVDSSPFLRELAANGGIDQLQRFWVDYHTRRRSDSPEAFEAYVRRRIGTEGVGKAGEVQASFLMGKRFMFMKGPEGDVNIPGTDLVAIENATGDLWIVDNKALAGQEIGSVTALLQNIVQNIAADIADFERNPNLHAPDVPPKVTAGIGRLKAAHQEILDDPDIKAHLADPANNGKVKSPEIQAKITAILDKHRIRRVVTTEGGNAMKLRDDIAAALDLEDI
jgi:hypothetical protein